MRKFYHLFLYAFMMICVASGVSAHPSSEPVSSDIARINMGMAVSLHPQMSLFDFQRMGFYKVTSGLSKEEFDQQVAELKKQNNTTELRHEENRIRNELSELGEQLQSILNSERTILPENMSEEGQKAHAAIQSRIAELNAQQLDLEYCIKFPEFTSPEQTRAILAKIESEVVDAIKSVAIADGYKLVLNTNVPVPFGYPVTYHYGTKFSTGPSGIEQALFYAFLHEPAKTEEDRFLKSDAIHRWLSMTSRPEAIDMLPIKPWPLVVEGGDCILEKVLKRLYDKYKINEEVWSHLRDVLSKTGTY